MTKQPLGVVKFPEFTLGMNVAAARVVAACLADEAFLAKSNAAGELAGRVYRALVGYDANCKDSTTPLARQGSDQQVAKSPPQHKMKAKPSRKRKEKAPAERGE